MPKPSRYAENHHLHARGPRIDRAALELLPAWLTGKAFTDRFMQTALVCATIKREHRLWVKV
jgi:hypothetical protein